MLSASNKDPAAHGSPAAMWHGAPFLGGSPSKRPPTPTCPEEDAGGAFPATTPPFFSTATHTTFTTPSLASGAISAPGSGAPVPLFASTIKHESDHAQAFTADGMRGGLPPRSASPGFGPYAPLAAFPLFGQPLGAAPAGLGGAILSHSPDSVLDAGVETRLSLPSALSPSFAASSAGPSTHPPTSLPTVGAGGSGGSGGLGGRTATGSLLDFPNAHGMHSGVHGGAIVGLTSPFPLPQPPLVSGMAGMAGGAFPSHACTTMPPSYEHAHPMSSQHVHAGICMDLSYGNSCILLQGKWS